VATPTEIQLTTWRSARWQQAIAGVSLLATLVGAAVAIATQPEWWVVLIWVVAALVLLIILIGLWFAATASARATDALRKSGVATRADVIHGEELVESDEIRYELTLQIRPVGREAFTVIHRCTEDRCKEAASNAPTSITALVDAATRTWAVVH
jgi:cation transport ATPase